MFFLAAELHMLLYIQCIHCIYIFVFFLNEINIEFVHSSINNRSGWANKKRLQSKLTVQIKSAMAGTNTSGYK